MNKVVYISMILGIFSGVFAAQQKISFNKLKLVSDTYVHSREVAIMIDFAIDSTASHLNNEVDVGLRVKIWQLFEDECRINQFIKASNNKFTKYDWENNRYTSKNYILNSDSITISHNNSTATINGVTTSASSQTVSTNQHGSIVNNNNSSAVLYSQSAPVNSVQTVERVNNSSNRLFDVGMGTAIGSLVTLIGVVFLKYIKITAKS